MRTLYYAALLPRRGPHIASHSVCLSVCLSVRPVRGSSFVIVYICTVLRANIQNRKTSVFDYRPASRVYLSARAEGRISYGHLGRTNLFDLLTAKPICSLFLLQTGFWSSYTAKSQPIWIKFCTHLLLYGIHLCADLDRDRRVGGSRPNQNDYGFLVILVTL